MGRDEALNILHAGNKRRGQEVGERGRVLSSSGERKGGILD
jgi:hypothetical protein